MQYVRAIALTTIYSGTLSLLARFAEAFIEIALRDYNVHVKLYRWLYQAYRFVRISIMLRIHCCPDPGATIHLYICMQRMCVKHTTKLKVDIKQICCSTVCSKTNTHTHKHDALWTRTTVCVGLLQTRSNRYWFEGGKLSVRGNKTVCMHIREGSPNDTFVLHAHGEHSQRANPKCRCNFVFRILYIDTIWYNIESHCSMCVSDLCTISLDFMWGLNSVCCTRLQYITLCNKHHCGV